MSRRGRAVGQPRGCGRSLRVTSWRAPHVASVEVPRVPSAGHAREPSLPRSAPTATPSSGSAVPDEGFRLPLTRGRGRGSAGARAHAELRVDARERALDRLLAEEQLGRDLLVGAPPATSSAMSRSRSLSAPGAARAARAALGRACACRAGAARALRRRASRSAPPRPRVGGDLAQHGLGAARRSPGGGERAAGEQPRDPPRRSGAGGRSAAATACGESPPRTRVAAGEQDLGARDAARAALAGSRSPAALGAAPSPSARRRRGARRRSRRARARAAASSTSRVGALERRARRPPRALGCSARDRARRAASPAWQRGVRGERAARRAAAAAARRLLERPRSASRPLAALLVHERAQCSRTSSTQVRHVLQPRALLGRVDLDAARASRSSSCTGDQRGRRAGHEHRCSCGCAADRQRPRRPWRTRRR